VKFKEYIQDYFVFSKKERLGVYVISVITMLVWALPYFFSEDENIENIFGVTYVQIDSAKQVLHVQQKNSLEYKYPKNQSGWKKSVVQSPNVAKGKLLLNINTVDSTALERLPAIGEKLSARIIKYRDRLGGFVSILQLKEVYGLSDSAFNTIRSFLYVEKTFQPQQLYINKDDYAALRKHPYATPMFIKMVLAYRKIHGKYNDIEALKKVEQVDVDLVNRLAPYLSFSD